MLFHSFFLFSLICYVLAGARLEPQVKLLWTTSARAGVIVLPRRPAPPGVNYTIFYKRSGIDSPTILSVTNVAQPQMLSPLSSASSYRVFVKATAITHSEDSPWIFFRPGKNSPWLKLAEQLLMNFSAML